MAKPFRQSSVVLLHKYVLSSPRDKKLRSKVAVDIDDKILVSSIVPSSWLNLSFNERRVAAAPRLARSLHLVKFTKIQGQYIDLPTQSLSRADYGFSSSTSVNKALARKNSGKLVKTQKLLDLISKWKQLLINNTKCL